MATDEKRLEDRIRRKLAREGFLLRKSRSTGGYMIVDAYTNIVEAGGYPGYDLDLDDVVSFTLQ